MDHMKLENNNVFHALHVSMDGFHQVVATGSVCLDKIGYCFMRISKNRKHPKYDFEIIFRFFNLYLDRTKYSTCKLPTLQI